MPRTSLFTSISEMQKYYPFQDNDEFFNELAPTLVSVERKYLLSDIDQDTWETVLTEIDAESFTNDIWKGLAERLQHAAAHLTALYHMDKSNVVFSSGGLMVTKTTSLVPASEFRTQQLRKALFRDVQDALDQVIEFLEGNTAVFTDWAASDLRSDLQGQIILTAKEFDTAYSINESRYIFRKLLPSQRYVIDTQIKAAIGEDFLKAYTADMADGLNADNKAIKAQLHRAVAYLTMGQGAPRIQQQFGPEGIALFDSEFAIAASRRQEGDLNRIIYLADDAIEKGLAELADLEHYLNENASQTKYPEYFASDQYSDPTIDHTDLNNYGEDDDPDRNHFAL